jgi:hypothetical protein
MIKNIIVDLLFILNRPIWGYGKDIKNDISQENKVMYLKIWIIGDIVIGIIFYIASLFF